MTGAITKFHSRASRQFVFELFVVTLVSDDLHAVLLLPMMFGHSSIGFQRVCCKLIFPSNDHSQPVLQDREHPPGVDGLDPT